MEISFKGKRALVTGAGRGMGRETVRRLHQCGAEVIALDVVEKDLAALKAEIPQVITVVVDLSDWNKTKAAVEKVGPVDCLVNNAGVTGLEKFIDVTEKELDRLLSVNLKAAINVGQTVARGMIQRGKGGTIVNVSSQASKAALAEHTSYTATKAALDGVTRVMALELGPYNIRVNTVNPTACMTEMGRQAWKDQTKAKAMLSKIPLGRFAEMEDVVNTTLFLLADKTTMITGSNVIIDGGFLAC